MDGPTSPLCIAVRPGEARRRARGPRPGCPRRSCRPPRRRARGPRAGGSGRGAAVRLVAVPVRVLGPAPVRSSASVSRTGAANRSPSRSSFAPPRRGGGSARVAGSSERRMWAQGRSRGLRPGRGIITRPARAGVEIPRRPPRTASRGQMTPGAPRTSDSGRRGAGWAGDRARAHDDSRTDPGLARAGPRPAETGTGLRKLQVRSTESRGRSRCGPGAGLRNASPARHRPPRLAPREPSATESARARSARAHLAQCEPR